MMKNLSKLGFVLTVLPLAAVGASQTTTYLFQNDFNAVEGSRPTITPINAINQNAFSSATVFGSTRTVYSMFGFAGNGGNSGLKLDTTGLVDPHHYSLELVMSFWGASGEWRKIADTSDRISDDGLYYDREDKLDLVDVVGHTAGTVLTTPRFYDVVVTVDNGVIQGYVDGVSQFGLSSNVMNLDNSSGHILNLFVDDFATSYHEYNDSQVGLVRLYDRVLSPNEVGVIAKNPFAVTPEPTSMAALGLGALALLRRRKKS